MKLGKLTDAALTVLVDIVFGTLFAAPSSSIRHLLPLAKEVEAECIRRGWMPRR